MKVTRDRLERQVRDIPCDAFWETIKTKVNSALSTELDLLQYECVANGTHHGIPAMHYIIEELNENT